PCAYQRLALHDFRIYTSWVPVKLRERDPVSQCYRCNRFGHKSHQCRYKVNDQLATRCARCGETHEGMDKCEAAPNCSNCVEYNAIALKRKWDQITNTDHSARDKSCPCRNKAITKAKQQNIDYGF